MKSKLSKTPSRSERYINMLSLHAAGLQTLCRLHDIPESLIRNAPLFAQVSEEDADIQWAKEMIEKIKSEPIPKETTTEEV